MKLKILILACLSLGPLSVMAGDQTGQRLLSKASCEYCHSYRDKGRGPTFKMIYRKWHGKPDAMEKMTAYITTPHTVVIHRDEGGEEVAHEPVKTWTPDDVKTVVLWMLSPERD